MNSAALQGWESGVKVGMGGGTRKEGGWRGAVKGTF